MSAATLQSFEKVPNKRLISLEKFLERYTNREEPIKYEWNRGIVEKKNRTMNRNQFLIIRALQNLFDRTTAKKQGGIITPEVDMFLATVNRTRRADLAFLTPQQMEESTDGIPSVCPFVIEIISKNDQTNEVEEKIIEYFDNGVEVIWVIYPKIKKVMVYTSIRDVKICFENDICSASPVMSDFNISVNDILG